MRTTPFPGTPATRTRATRTATRRGSSRSRRRSPLAQFTLQASDDSDLDLAVYRVASPTDLRYDARWVSAIGSGEKQVTLESPAEGSYLVVADVSDAARGDDVGSRRPRSSRPAPRAITDQRRPTRSSRPRERTSRYTLSWAGLQAGHAIPRRRDLRRLRGADPGAGRLRAPFRRDPRRRPPSRATPRSARPSPRIAGHVGSRRTSRSRTSGSATASRFRGRRRRRLPGQADGCRSRAVGAGDGDSSRATSIPGSR